jgi:mannose/fructose/N-acetylgalactosamine-specific phosphotransferase system component IIB
MMQRFSETAARKNNVKVADMVHSYYKKAITEKTALNAEEWEKLSELRTDDIVLANHELMLLLDDIFGGRYAFIKHAPIVHIS